MRGQQEEGEKPVRGVGKRIIQNFTKKEWLKFYTYLSYL